eukprot:6461131-Lingulodinium_polyedra.AAC.1
MSDHPCDELGHNIRHPLVRGGIIKTGRRQNLRPGCCMLSGALRTVGTQSMRCLAGQMPLLPGIDRTARQGRPQAYWLIE